MPLETQKQLLRKMLVYFVAVEKHVFYGKSSLESWVCNNLSAHSWGLARRAVLRMKASRGAGTAVVTDLSPGSLTLLP